MKKALSYFLVAFALAGAAFAQQGAPALAASNSSQDPNVRRARELLDKMIAALGGDAYLNYTDVVQQGRTHGFYRGEPRGVGVPFIRSFRPPSEERVEFFKERDWIIVHNGDKGWETTFRGTREEDPKETANWVRRREHSLETVLRVWLKQPGTMLFYEGTALANTRMTHKVGVMNEQQQSVTLFIDDNSYLPVQKNYVFRDPEFKDRVEEGEIYDMYRKVQGIQTPFNIVRTQNGEMSSQRFLNQVSFNNGLTDAVFAAPKVTITPKKGVPDRDRPPQ